MPISDNAKLYIKGITFALLGILAAALGIVAVGFFGDYFAAYPVLAAIAVSKSVGIDLLGAVVPLTAAAICAILLVKTTSSFTRKFAVAFLASVTFAFLLFHPSSEGVEGYSLLYALLVGAVSVALNIFPKLCVDRKTVAASTLLALACVPLSIFVVDAVYSPSFAGSVIGGNGLADALLLSTLFAPFGVIAIYSVLGYVAQTVWLIRKSQSAPSMQHQPPIDPVAAKETETAT